MSHSRVGVSIGILDSMGTESLGDSDFCAKTE